ncbi:hypothetical protein BMS3Bbin13_01803 [bacterium BMS3Bbin13]|nr:hypothetical protein BMS3Bbin13_01803 [bacterium BMS3Bbin13]
MRLDGDPVACTQRAQRLRVVDAAVGQLRVEPQQRLAHRHARERPAEIVVSPLAADDRIAQQFHGHVAKQGLGQGHQVLVTGVGLIELKHRELGIVARGDALVAEVAVQLVDLLQPPDHQPLEIQFRGDAQIEVHLQGVVMGDERTRRGAARDGLHHRCLDLDEAALVEEPAQVTHDRTAQEEHPARGLVHHQIHVALPIAHFLVGQSVELLGQRAQRLDQHPRLRGAHRQFPGAGPEQRPLDPHDVADVPALEIRIDALGQRVALEKHLDAPAHVLQLRETRLAHHALGQHAPGDPHRMRLGLQPLPVHVVEDPVQVRGQRVTAKVVGKRRSPLAQRGQLGAAFGDQPVVVGFAHAVPSSLQSQRRTRLTRRP